MPISVDEAYNYIGGLIASYAGSFFGSPDEIELGAGLIFENVRYPRYVPDSEVFATVEGLIYIVSHECDVNINNNRPFNDDIAIVPIIPFENFVEDFLNVAVPDGNQQSLLQNLIHNNISRLFYLPPFPNRRFSGVIFFNQIASTKLSAIKNSRVSRTISLSELGRRRLDYMLLNHFFRPTQPLPLHTGMLH